MAKWETPKLIVLAKGTPEERVLVICKNHDTAGPDLTFCKPLDTSGGIGGEICRGVTGS